MSTTGDARFGSCGHGHSAPELGYCNKDELKATHSQVLSQRVTRLRRARSTGTASVSKAAQLRSEGINQWSKYGEKTGNGQQDTGPATRHLEEPNLSQIHAGNVGDTAPGTHTQYSDEDPFVPNASSGYFVFLNTFGADGSHIPDFEYDPMDSSEAEALGYPKLAFKPHAMQTWFLAVTVMFFSACVAAIVVVMREARSRNGVIHVETWEARLAYRYVPIALGSVSTLLWKTVATTYARMHPYLMMSASKPGTTDYWWYPAAVKRALHAHFPLGIFQPGFFGLVAFLLTGRGLIFACMLIDSVNNLSLTALMAAFVQLTPNGHALDAVFSTKIGHVLVSVYSLLSAVSLGLLATLNNKLTVLEWEPVSIADQLALIQGSNIGPLFDDLEMAESKDYVRLLKGRGPTFGSLRLGYWKHRHDGSIWHGMAFVPGTAGEPCATNRGSQTNYISTKTTHTASKKRATRQQERADGDLEAAAAAYEVHQASQSTDHEIALIRYRNVLGMVCEPFLALYLLATLTALSVMVLALSKGYLKPGIPLHLENLESSAKLSEYKGFNSQTFRTKENFTFIFLPVFLMNCFNFLWFNADEFYRNMRPFAGMNTPAPATSNLLLDYPTCAPVVVTVKAATNRHWRVALFSLLSLLGAVPPIVVAGIFSSTSGGMVHIRPGNFWATFAILIVYLICIVFARPSSAYRLPRCVWDIADLALFCYKSRILDDRLLGAPIFSAQGPKETRIHMESRIHLAKKEYVFGMYLDTDGKKHMGFDVSERRTPSGQAVSVTTFEPGRAIYLTPWGLHINFRDPEARVEA